MPDILCIGSAHWDIIGRTPAALAASADVPGRITRAPGGVAMNIAMTLMRFGMCPALLTAVGRDTEGDDLVAAATHMGLDLRWIYRSDDLPTDRYMAIEGAGGLVAAIADAHSLEAAGDRILRPLVDGRLGSADAPWKGLIALDGNLTEALLATIATAPVFRAADLRLAPASPGKAERIRPLISHPGVTLYVNLAEAGLICQRRFDDAGDAAGALMDRGARRVLVTDGARDCADGCADAVGAARVIFDTPPDVRVTHVTGAGDTFMAAHIVAQAQGADRATALSAALRAAARHISGEIAT